MDDSQRFVIRSTFVQNYQKITKAMQNLDEERHSWLKLSIILFVLVSLGLLTYLASLLNVKINYDDADEIFKMKLEQLISVVIILFCWVKILVSINKTEEFSKVINFIAVFILLIVPINFITLIFTVGYGSTNIGIYLILFLVLVT